jgi:hypothetical protein
MPEPGIEPPFVSAHITIERVLTAAGEDNVRVDGTSSYHRGYRDGLEAAQIRLRFEP